ncbi:glycosyltransferase family 2 protein [Mechercharimyces sp. CAU 1602]|uniref:glycosyltransferase family 2 protein n=1 Tax=Mechercharimyces sp. CAU 1602 TaxID=2973933 RepID=UPI002161D296|nr:glycosyltransferase family 2 protein [Mechercharimyces sp. CAU 1602]MCS1352301.1 glycosyltransferase family 2 protein [Mechercharimyces sp. CAU 1602]
MTATSLKKEEEIMYSVIVPMYNEEEVIALCYERLCEVMKNVDAPYELIFVNDGSQDRTKSIVETLCTADHHLRIINFSRNFGHQPAITAGMEAARGEAIVVIDADLQDPPELILEMIAKWKQGYDVVYAKRRERKGESFFKKATAALFYRTLHFMTDISIPLDTGDFRLLDRKVCAALTLCKERNRFVRGLVSWVGFKQTAVEYERHERHAGQTKYSLKKMIRLSLDAITSFSNKPLILAIYLGFLLASTGFLALFYLMYLKLFTTQVIAGWTSIMSLNIIFFGVTLFMLGVIGQYIARIFDEVRERPLYIIESQRERGRYLDTQPDALVAKNEDNT